MLDPLALLNDRQDRFEGRLAEAEAETEQIPVLRKEVELLTKAVDRNTNVMLTAAISLIVTGVLTVVSALILKGVIG